MLLHGFTGCLEAWGGRVLEGLAASTRVVAVDLPGHGKSPAGDGSDAGGIREVVRRVLATLDAAGVDRADWIGYSMGGRVALAAAVTGPERVRTLVLEGASPGIGRTGDRAARRRSDEALARRIESEGIERFVDYWSGLPLFASQARLDPAVKGAVRARRLAQDPSGLAAALRAYGAGSQPSYWGRLGGIDVPTLLLTGGEDAKFDRIARRMAARIPGAVHRRVPGAGHTVHLESPDRWLELVVPFVADAGPLPGPAPSPRG